MQATLERGWQMKDVEVDRLSLLERVQANREKHLSDYKEAFSVYIQAAKEALEKRKHAILKAIKEKIQELDSLDVDRDPAVSGSLSTELCYFRDLNPPVSHVDDYDQVIEMLKMEVNKTIKLPQDQFVCYCMDKWSWKKGFSEMTESYSKMKRIN